MREGPSGAWYARSGSRARELYTIMHLPYTSMVLSYVLIGAMFSPTFYAQRVFLTLFTYFLGLGLSAHALNELYVPHWTKALGKKELVALFIIPLFGALCIGVYGMSKLFLVSGSDLPPLVLMVLILLEIFFLFAYNTNSFGGRFHSDVAFAFSWAVLPTLVSFYVNALTVTVGALVVAGAMAATAGIEINLSRWCKELRRRGPLNELRFADGDREVVNGFEFMTKPERALKLIVLVVDLSAISLVALRLFG